MVNFSGHAITASICRMHLSKSTSPWNIGQLVEKNKTPCDTYATDIFLMRVLIPPATSGPVTPKKRKFLQTDPLTPDISPKKFKAFASSA